MHLNLCGPKGTIYSEWEGITNLFLWMQEIDETIELLPWAVKDHNHNLPVAITSIPQVFFDFHTYTPGLASLQVSLRSQLELGDVRHPSLFLQSLVPPTQLSETLEPWMTETNQCMWVCQLPLVEQTKCISWLLYLAPEYNLNNLHWQIKQDMGIDVELRFCSIVDKAASRADCTITPTKAIHLDVDHNTCPHS